MPMEWTFEHRRTLMIDWKSIKDLHTTKSLEKIVGNWYGLDVLYVDAQGRVQFLQEPGYTFKSPFLKLQMSVRCR